MNLKLNFILELLDANTSQMRCTINGEFYVEINKLNTIPQNVIKSTKFLFFL